jgi:hypothetical protein
VLFKKEAIIWEDLIAGAEEAEVSEKVAAISEAIPVLEKCIKQLALNVAKNVKCHSNPQKAGQFIVKTAI